MAKMYFTAKVNGKNGKTYAANVTAEQIARSFEPTYDGMKPGNISELKYDTVRRYHNYVVSLCPSMKSELDASMAMCFGAMSCSDNIHFTNGVSLVK